MSELIISAETEAAVLRSRIRYFEAEDKRKAEKIDALQKEVDGLRKRIAYNNQFEERFEFHRQQGCSEQEAIAGAVDDLGSFEHQGSLQKRREGGAYETVGRGATEV